MKMISTNEMKRRISEYGLTEYNESVEMGGVEIERVLFFTGDNASCTIYIILGSNYNPYYIYA